jgi:hypothetical protein
MVRSRRSAGILGLQPEGLRCADCVEKLADDYFKAIFAQRNFASSFFLESSLRCPRVADSNITDKNGCRSFSTQSADSSHSSSSKQPVGSD